MNEVRMNFIDFPPHTAKREEWGGQPLQWGGEGDGWLGMKKKKGGGGDVLSYLVSCAIWLETKEL